MHKMILFFHREWIFQSCGIWNAFCLIMWNGQEEKMKKKWFIFIRIREHSLLFLFFSQKKYIVATIRFFSLSLRFHCFEVTKKIQVLYSRKSILFLSIRFGVEFICLVKYLMLFIYIRICMYVCTVTVFVLSFREETKSPAHGSFFSLFFFGKYIRLRYTNKQHIQTHSILNLCLYLVLYVRMCTAIYIWIGSSLTFCNLNTSECRSWRLLNLNVAWCHWKEMLISYWRQMTS